MIKLLAIDMDGTCLPHQLTDQNSLFRYVISSNGAKVTDYHTQKTLYQSEIPKQTALSLLNACQNEKLGITAHIRHEYLLQGHSLVFLGRLVYRKDARKVRYVQNMEQTIQELSCDVEELQFYFFSKNSVPQLKMHLANYPSLRAACTGQYAEIFSSETSKGRALTHLAQSLGIAKSEIACIGDGENDLSMFEASGMKLAMGNAVEMLKKEADYILPDCDHNGVTEGAALLERMTT